MSNYRGGRRSQATSEDARTPIAWQHRDINYHQQGYSDRYRTDHVRRGPASVSDQTSNTERSSRAKRSPREAQAAPYRGRTPADSEASSTTSESSRDTKVPTHGGHGAPAMHLVPVSGGGPPTIRSAQSVPMLLPGLAGPPMTWDGEPCPVHHHPPMAAMPVGGPLSLPPPQPHPGLVPPRAASLYDLRVATPHSVYGPPPDGLPPGVMTVDRKGALLAAAPGSAMGRPPLPPGLLPPLMRPRPIVRAEDGAPRELPVRDPRKPSLVPPPAAQKQSVGCGGFKKVLAISLAVVVLGVILAVALFFITN